MASVAWRSIWHSLRREALAAYSECRTHVMNSSWLLHEAKCVSAHVLECRTCRLCPCLNRTKPGAVTRHNQGKNVADATEKSGRFLANIIFVPVGVAKLCPALSFLWLVFFIFWCWKDKWTHWGLSPGPSACGADVIPLHHVPLEMFKILDSFFSFQNPRVPPTHFQCGRGPSWTRYANCQTQ